MPTFGVCIVLYNPTDEDIGNILKYINNFNFIYLMDNSTKSFDFSSFFKNTISVVRYIKLDCNEGTGKALNVACEKAIIDKVDFLLTCDQDSDFSMVDFNKCFLMISELNTSNVGQICLNPDPTPLSDIISVNNNITSGSFVNLHLYGSNNRFCEGLFLDWVDYDFSANQLLNNMKILMLPISFKHKRGYGIRTFKLFKWKWNYQDYNPFRYYYISRNQIILKKKYGDYFRPCYSFGHYIGRCLSGGFKYFIAISKGIHDGKKGILGKYKQHEKHDRMVMKKYETII